MRYEGCLSPIAPSSHLRSFLASLLNINDKVPSTILVSHPATLREETRLFLPPETSVTLLSHYLPATSTYLSLQVGRVRVLSLDNNFPGCLYCCSNSRGLTSVPNTNEYCRMKYGTIFCNYRCKNKDMQSTYGMQLWYQPTLDDYT